MIDGPGDFFDRLEESFAILVGETLVPGVSGYTLGAVSTVIPGEQAARGFIDSNASVLEGLGLGDPSVLRVGDAWEFMRRAAGEGLAGVACGIPGPDLGKFMFMLRVEEAGAALPTVLASIGENGWHDECRTRGGLRSLSHSELLHWDRFDILDRVSARWGVESPFRDWEQGDPLYELRSDHEVVTLADVLAPHGSHKDELSFHLTEGS